MNECEGCIYDVFNNPKPNIDEIEIILEHCSSCKRAMRDKFKDRFKDNYRRKE